MPKSRRQIALLGATTYYYCASRCVRRAFLCGFDQLTGRSYEHRREWVEQRIVFLAGVFAIDVCAYALMSNHHHVVLHINKPEALSWSYEEVCERWHKIYKGTLLTQKFLRKDTLTEVELRVVKEKLEQWRLNLSCISWFMRSLNEPIARMANAEDKCTGRFFESRFKSQALLDEKALLGCMAYVDLNPVRAKMAKTPEQSEHTSIKKRVKAVKQSKAQPKSLAQFVGDPREPMPQGLPFHLKDYLELVDWTGRIINPNKRGFIDSDLPPILDRLEIEPEQWMLMVTKFVRQYAPALPRYITSL